MNYISLQLEEVSLSSSEKKLLISSTGFKNERAQMIFNRQQSTKGPHRDDVEF